MTEAGGLNPLTEIAKSNWVAFTELFIQFFFFHFMDSWHDPDFPKMGYKISPAFKN